MITKLISTPNQKGGVGKTSTTIHIAHSLAMHNLQVLIVDFDPQGQAATALGVAQEPSVFNLLVSPGSDPFQWVRKTGREGLDILPGNRATATAQVVLNAEQRPINAVKDALRVLMQAYDFIILDTAPSVGGIQERAVFASDMVIIPTATEYLSIDGLGQIITMLSNLRTAHNWQGRLLGVLPTFYDEQTRESQQSLEHLNETFGDSLLNPIHRATLLRECASEGKTVFEMNPQHRAAREYEALASQVIRQA